MTWLIMTWGSAQDGFIFLSFFDRFGDFVAKMEKATTCVGTTRAIRLPTTSPEPTTSPLARPISPRPIVFQDGTTERIEAQNHQDHIFIRDRTYAETRTYVINKEASKPGGRSRSSMKTFTQPIQ